MQEERFEGRFMCADLVGIDWMTGEDDFRTGEAVLEDISPHGACVQVDEPIPLGSTITISALSAQGARFSGYVSYCVYRDYGYFVGIRLADENQWSTGAFRPQHLTNIRELAEKSAG